MFFNEAQWRTLQALADRIIPADEYPGAWDAGVGDFLVRLLGTSENYAQSYRAGLECLDLEAAAIAGRSFVELTTGEQDLLLTGLEAGKVVADWPIDPAAFFTLAATQVMEGYYSDPGNGGNKNGIAWRMIGFEVTA